MVSRAVLHMELGRKEQAQAAFDATTVAFPASATAWFNQADLRRFKPGDGTIGRMEALLAPGGLQSHTDRMLLHFALGKAYLDLGDLAPGVSSFRYRQRAEAADFQLTIPQPPRSGWRASPRCSRPNCSRPWAGRARRRRCRCSCWACRAPAPRWLSRSWRRIRRCMAPGSCGRCSGWWMVSAASRMPCRGCFRPNDGDGARHIWRASRRWLRGRLQCRGQDAVELPLCRADPADPAGRADHSYAGAIRWILACPATASCSPPNRRSATT